MSVEIIHGDSRFALSIMPSSSIDSVVTDPPYALTSIVKRFGGDNAAPVKNTDVYARSSSGFMGKKWDTGEVAFDPAFWNDVLRVLKPGGHVVAFGGTRTYHRLACAIEDGGFEIRDQIGWLYGSGFPKSHNQDGDWKGWGTALKPAWEPIVLARKPIVGTVAGNLAAWGVGAINIDDCRVGDFVNTTPPGTDRFNARAHELGYRPSAYGREGEASADRRYAERGATNFAAAPGPRGGAPEGRWPANIIHDGSDDVIAAFPSAPGQIAKASSSDARKTQNVYGSMKRGSDGAEPRDFGGSAARFFYCAKASRSDRNDGLADFDEKPLLWSAGTQNPGSFQSAGTKKAAANPHPTVKPTDLMRYLCRLITPPGGTVLDMFMGSGSTGRGAVMEGFNFIGIEREDEYVPIARARIAAVTPPGLFE